jgi:hypothetical protein
MPENKQTPSPPEGVELNPGPLGSLTGTGEDMVALARQVKKLLEAGHDARHRGLAFYRAAGEALLKARAECERPENPYYRKWLAWLKENVGISRTQAYRYMALAKLPVTGTLEEQEAAWQRISGNAPTQDAQPDTDADDDDDAGTEGSGAPDAGNTTALAGEAAQDTGGAEDHVAGDDRDEGGHEDGHCQAHPRNNAKDAHTVPVTVAHCDYPPWQEAVKFAEKVLNVDNLSDAVVGVMLLFPRMWDRG